MSSLIRIESGEWQHDPALGDYRAEWLTDVLVERATCLGAARPQTHALLADHPALCADGVVWARFWFRRESWLVDKFFSSHGHTLGFYVPVCGSVEYHAGHLRANWYGLALWIGEQGFVTVLGEAEFDHARLVGTIAPVALEQAEVRIRELTTLTAQRRFPPAFVRNFSIVSTSEP